MRLKNVAVRRRLLYVVIGALALTGVAPIAEANHSCYPAKCAEGDAALRSIGTPGRMYAGNQSFVTVTGKNIGRASTVVADLNSSNATIEPHGKTRLHAGADERFTVYFNVTPHRAERTKFRGCVAAKPNDADRSNNCGSVKVRVKRAP